MSKLSRALASAIVLAVAMAAPLSAVAATDVGPGPTTRMEVTRFGSGVLELGDDLSVGVTVRNTAQTAGTLSVQLRVTDAPLRSRSALDGFIANPRSVHTHAVDTRDVDGAAAAIGARVPVTLTGRSAQLDLPPQSWGVYGVFIVLREDRVASETVTSALTWQGSKVPALNAAIVATATGTAERIVRVAAASAVPGAALALDPTALSDEDAAAMSLRREIYRLPSGNPDLASLAHSDDRTLLAWSLENSKSDTPQGLAGLPWLALTPVADRSTLRTVFDAGAAAALVVPSASGSAPRFPDGTTTSVAEVDLLTSNVRVIVPDDHLSELVASFRPNSEEAGARIVADAALTAAAGETTIVISPGEGWVLPDAGPSQSLVRLMDAPWVKPSTVAAVVGGRHVAEASVAGTAPRDGDVSPRDVASLARRLERLVSLADTAEEAASIVTPGAGTLLRPLALGLRDSPEIRAATVGFSLTRVDATLDALGVNAGSDVNLIASSGKVPIVVHNDLDVDSTVTVVVTSTSANLIIKDAPVVTVPAHGETTALVPVEGVSSADVSSTIVLRNSLGEAVASPQALRIRVRADWGNAVTAVFSAGLVLLLAAGVIRTVRRGRRATRLGPEEAAEALEYDDE